MNVERRRTGRVPNPAVIRGGGPGVVRQVLDADFDLGIACENLEQVVELPAVDLDHEPATGRIGRRLTDRGSEKILEFHPMTVVDPDTHDHLVTPPASGRPARGDDSGS